MKKIMVALAAVTLSAVTYAGSVNWGISAVVDPTSGADFSGGAAYLFLSSISSTDVEDAIKGGTFLTTYASQAAYTAEFDGGELYESKILAGSSGSTTYYSVVIDNDTDPAYYFVTDTINQNIPTSTAAKSFAWEMGGSKGDWTAIGGSSVPEPTSGLLMLLGVAGLALRRKCA